MISNQTFYIREARRFQLPVPRSSSWTLAELEQSFEDDIQSGLGGKSSRTKESLLHLLEANG